ncbi:unnamed protein product [marine sediment metagenome]|uniref:Uncharacterized protein n=1 Tax=marine sediment metagenome TaxID=412755 RepID=X1CKI8_9ZZZZ
MGIHAWKLLGVQAGFHNGFTIHKIKTLSELRNTTDLALSNYMTEELMKEDDFLITLKRIMASFIPNQKVEHQVNVIQKTVKICADIPVKYSEERFEHHVKDILIAINKGIQEISGDDFEHNYLLLFLSNAIVLSFSCISFFVEAINATVN